VSNVKLQLLQRWQCDACKKKGAVPVEKSPPDDDDPLNWDIPEGAVVCCLPDPASGDLFWIAQVLERKRPKHKILKIRWFESHPSKEFHYVPGDVQRIQAATLTVRDVRNLMTQVGPSLYRLRNDPRLFITS